MALRRDIHADHTALTMDAPAHSARLTFAISASIPVYVRS